MLPKDEDERTILPKELLFEVFSHLHPEDLCCAAQVNKLWKTVADDDELWRRHCHKRYVQENSLNSLAVGTFQSLIQLGRLCT